MTVTDTEVPATTSKLSAKRPEWNWRPDGPVEVSPFFVWPPNPVKMARWLAKAWLDLSVYLLLLGTSTLTWFYLQPSLDWCRQFEFSWIAIMYGRNLALMIAVAGGLHLYFYAYKKQGKIRKYDHRDQAVNNRTYSFRSQVWDNMFWSLASGVTVWTAYEALYMWAYANGYIPGLSLSENPVWFVLQFVLIPVFSAFHFYWAHRWLHWPPLYRLAHSLHHRNVNVGPWSGLSMHPIEHIIYMTAGLIHWVVASHPIHFLFHMHWLALGAATSHAGYEGVVAKDENRLALGDFYHQLHHRYFECNYGNREFPLDVWFGTYHDGSAEATVRIRERRRRMHGEA